MTLSGLVSTAGAVLLALMLIVICVQLVEQLRLRGRLAEYETLIEEQEAGNEAVSEEIRRLHEPGYIELLARKYLGLVKPGETVFQLED